jgi:hypothetical protein
MDEEDGGDAMEGVGPSVEDADVGGARGAVLRLCDKEAAEIDALEAREWGEGPLMPKNALGLLSQEVRARDKEVATRTELLCSSQSHNFRLASSFSTSQKHHDCPTMLVLVIGGCRKVWEMVYSSY